MRVDAVDLPTTATTICPLSSLVGRHNNAGYFGDNIGCKSRHLPKITQLIHSLCRDCVCI